MLNKWEKYTSKPIKYLSFNQYELENLMTEYLVLKKILWDNPFSDSILPVMAV